MNNVSIVDQKINVYKIIKESNSYSLLKLELNIIKERGDGLTILEKENIRARYGNLIENELGGYYRPAMENSICRIELDDIPTKETYEESKYVKVKKYTQEFIEISFIYLFAMVFSLLFKGFYLLWFIITLIFIDWVKGHTITYEETEIRNDKQKNTR